MKKTILSTVKNWGIGCLFVSAIALTSCGGSKENPSTSSETEVKEFSVQGNIIGLGKFKYSENGNNYSRNSLKIKADSVFEGEIIFKDDYDTTLAKGILKVYKEHSDFNYDALFKRVKLTLIPATEEKYKGAFYVTKIENISALPVNVVAAEAAADSTAKSRWVSVGDDLYPNTSGWAITNLGIKNDTLNAYSGVFTAGVGFSLGYLGADYLKGIKKLNGNKWVTADEKFNGVVHSSITFNNAYYAGGKYTAIGGQRIYSIAKNESGSWSTLGSNSPLGNDAKIISMVEYNKELYVGGDFYYTFGEASATGIARWNGAQWSNVGIGKKSDYGNKIANGLPGFVRSLVVYKNELYAGGSFITADGKFVNGIARWNGKEWNSVGLGVKGDVWCMAVFNNELYVGGQFTSVEGTDAQSLAKWDGTKWTVISSPMQVNNNKEGHIRTMYVHNGALYLAGVFLIEKENFIALNLAKYDGTKFSTVGNGEVNTEVSPKPIYGFSGRVNSFITYTNALYIGGDFSIVRGNSSIKNIAKLSVE